MEKEGIVSLWIGNINSQTLLDEYTELIYTDEDEWLPSPFLKEFNINIGDFNEDFIERIWYNIDINTLAELIAGCSYDDIVIDNFASVFDEKLTNGMNSAILLYNFDYNDNPQKCYGKIDFRYIGSVKYLNKKPY